MIDIFETIIAILVFDVIGLILVILGYIIYFTIKVNISKLFLRKMPKNLDF